MWSSHVISSYHINALVDHSTWYAIQNLYIIMPHQTLIKFRAALSAILNFRNIFFFPFFSFTYRKFWSKNFFHHPTNKIPCNKGLLGLGFILPKKKHRDTCCRNINNVVWDDIQCVIKSMMVSLNRTWGFVSLKGRGLPTHEINDQQRVLVFIFE